MTRKEEIVLASKEHKYPKSPWISVEDNLPEQYEEVLVYYREPFLDLSIYDIASIDNTDKFYTRIHGYNAKVLYWMPIPKIPNKE